MSKLPQISNRSANFCKTVKLDGLQIDMLTNGAHGIIVSGEHGHPDYEIQAAISGEYSAVFRDRQLRLKPEAVCLIPPNCVHRSSAATEGARQIALNFSLRYKPGQNSPLTEAAQLLPKEEPILFPDAVPLWNALCLFAEELTQPELASGALIDLLMQQICILLLRSLKKRSNLSGGGTELSALFDLKSERFNKIEAFFHQRHAEQVSEDDLARELAVSRRQTSRILRQQCGKSFHEKLTEMRMHYALQYLVHTDLSAEEIAFQVGFASVSGFFAAFKKKHHMTPVQYRNKERKE